MAKKTDNSAITISVKEWMKTQFDKGVSVEFDQDISDLEDAIEIAQHGNTFLRAMADRRISADLRIEIVEKIKLANQYDTIGWVELVAEYIASEHGKAMRRYFKNDLPEDRRRVEDCNTAQNLMRKTKDDMYFFLPETAPKD